jgi:hypothetical protein
MKIHIVLFLTVLFSIPAFSQEHGDYRVGKEFNSIFQELDSGEFHGTINGVLSLKRASNSDLILDFQAGQAELFIKPDPNQVYDVSTKTYQGFTTSGKTKICYSTYASANKMTIKLTNGDFIAGSHDGASDMVINGILYEYISEGNTEYLSLIFNNDVKFDNFWWLRDQGFNPKEAKEMKQEIIVKANSVIVFVINGQ